MTTSPDKLKACWRGAVTADAATMGTHWIYDPNELKEQVQATPDAPEFFTPPNPRFYSDEEFPGHYKAGMPSPYGELLMFGMDYCAKHPKEPIDPTKMLKAKYEWATTYGGRQDHALKQVLEALEKVDKDFSKPCGADDSQAMTYMKAVPVAALFAGKPDLPKNVETAVRVHQDNDMAANIGQAAALLLEYFLTDKGTSIRGALTDVKPKVHADVASVIDEAFMYADDSDATVDTIMTKLAENHSFAAIGRSCQLPGAFLVPLFIMLREEAKEGISDDDLFINSIRENIFAAGDNCSRSIFIGALLGARSGSVPASLVEKVHAETLAKVDSDIEAVIGA